METTERPPPYAFSDGHLTSPPLSPGSRPQVDFPPQTIRTSPKFKRMGVSMEFIKPIGQGPQFNFTRPHSRGATPSTTSGRVCATTPQDSGDESDDDNDENDSADDSDDSDDDDPEANPSRNIDEADITFILEELGSTDGGYNSDVEVVQPSHFEDAKSEKSEGITEKFKEMQVSEHSTDEDEEERRERIYRRKKKRWSAGIFKRSHSQSIEGDSSYSDNDPLDDVDSTARRLRRRVRGPADRRASLVFEDRGFSNSNNIAEVEEPEDGFVLHSKGPPSIPSDDAFTLDELPFWDVEVEEVEETMDVDDDSS